MHESDPTESTGSTSEGLSTLTRSESIALAKQWVDAKLQYCQSANGARDYDTACSTTCTRQKNPAWDPYRSDCSGLVSWAWGLPAPGRITTQFAPFKADITKTIPAIELRPGDAVNNATHIMLFESWVTPGKRAKFLEEPGCSSSQPYAREDVSDVTINGSAITVASHGETFTAIRYGALETPKKSPPDAAAPHEAGGDANEPSSTPEVASPMPSASTQSLPPTGMRDGHGGGCNVSSNSSPLSPLALVAVVVLLARRRRH